jgi:hypothetical protein
MGGMYMLTFMNPQNEESMGVRMGDLWLQNAATMTYPSSWECLVQVPLHIPVIVGRSPILLPNHTADIQLWKKEVFQHIKVHVTHNGSLGKKEWSVNLCSAYSTENIHSPLDCLACVRQLGANSAIPRSLDYGDSTFLISER